MKASLKTSMYSIALALTVSCVGCSKASTSASKPATGPSPAGEKYIALAEPNGAVPVADARKTAKTDDEITLVGRIGGSEKPFVDGVAAFTIVDPKIPHCAADEGCETPWDYCCVQNQVKDNIAMVKLVGSGTSPVAVDAKQLLGVKELSIVVVKGTAKRDESGNLTVLATQVFVKN